MIFNVSKFRYLANNPVTALSWGMRLRGLIGRKFTESMDGMIFPRCNSIHTFFMGQKIDIIFLDREERVVGVYPMVKPWMPVVRCGAGVTTVELPAGKIAESLTTVGDQLNLNMEYSADTIDKKKYDAILYREAISKTTLDIKRQVTREQ